MAPLAAVVCGAGRARDEVDVRTLSCGDCRVSRLTKRIVNTTESYYCLHQICARIQRMVEPGLTQVRLIFRYQALETHLSADLDAREGGPVL